jgi:hypothetical protein
VDQSLKIRGSATHHHRMLIPRPHNTVSESSTSSVNAKQALALIAIAKNVSLNHESRYPFEAHAPEIALFLTVGLFRMSTYLSQHYDSQPLTININSAYFSSISRNETIFSEKTHTQTHTINRLCFPTIQHIPHPLIPKNDAVIRP